MSEPLSSCPTCGYVFQPLETVCPRCRVSPRVAQPPAAPMAPPAPPLAGAAAAGGLTQPIQSQPQAQAYPSQPAQASYTAGGLSGSGFASLPPDAQRAYLQAANAAPPGFYSGNTPGPAPGLEPGQGSSATHPLVCAGAFVFVMVLGLVLGMLVRPTGANRAALDVESAAEAFVSDYESDGLSGIRAKYAGPWQQYRDHMPEQVQRERSMEVESLSDGRTVATGQIESKTPEGLWAASVYFLVMDNRHVIQRVAVVPAMDLATTQAISGIPEEATQAAPDSSPRPF